MRIRRIAVVMLLAIAATISVEAQSVKTYKYSGSEACIWGARDQQHEILMSYQGLYGRISVQAPPSPAFWWVVLSNNGKPLVGGSATTANGKPLVGGSATTALEALNDLCGKLIHIIGTEEPR